MQVWCASGRDTTKKNIQDFLKGNLAPVNNTKMKTDGKGKPSAKRQKIDFSMPAIPGSTDDEMHKMYFFA